jgi:hypothetical protein
MKTSMEKNIARIENIFVEKAQYNLSVREQKVILYLVSQIVPEELNLRIQTVPVKSLEEILKKDDKKWGGLYEEMQQFSDQITDKKISFPTNVTIKGKPVSGHINWFSSVMPVKNEKGEVCMEFEFSPRLEPFLLKLNEYVKIDRNEVRDMKYRYSIRLYQLFKAIIQKQEKYKKVVKKTYSVDEIREMLQLEDKYTAFKALNQFVISKALHEINLYTVLHVEAKGLRNRLKKVEEIEFSICYKKDMPKQLALLSDGEKKKIESMSKFDISEKRKVYNFEKFKKLYPKIYKEKTREVQVFYKGQEIKHKTIIPNSISALCETWFIENVNIASK